MFTVAVSNTSLSEALKSLPDNPSEPVTIKLMPGIYREKITIRRSNLTILGMGNSPVETVLTYDDYAFDHMEDGTKRGTFRSYSVLVDACDVTLKNLTVQNSSGDENIVGQAIALYVDGDRFRCIDCQLLGRQDTLFTGPLPEKELQPGGFIGPKQFSPRIPTRQYYENCYLCGNVDFIFGGATAYFENCQLVSLSHGKDQDIQGYVTAPSTPEGQPFGYVFHNCYFTTGECAAASVYLGRSWRDYAKCVLINCALGSHIHPGLFHDWNKPAARLNSYYALDHATCLSHPARKNCFNDSFVKLLSQEEASLYSRQKVLSGTDNWEPQQDHSDSK